MIAVAAQPKRSGWPSNQPGVRKAQRAAARAEGKCGECGSRPAMEEKATCVECAEAKKRRKKPIADSSQIGKPKGSASPNPHGMPAADLAPELEGRLLRPKAGELCYCGAKVSFAGVLFCAQHGREYVEDLKRRFRP